MGKLKVQFTARSTVTRGNEMRRETHIEACEVRCEKCLGKPLRCPKCEAEVQTLLAAIGGRR